jgi:hypothetical protein
VGGYDPVVDDLNVFSTLLESTNRILDDATPRLDALGQGLYAHHTDLGSALSELTGDVDTLEKETQEWEAKAVAETKELDGAVHKALEQRLPAIDTDSEASQGRTHTVLTTHGATLQSRLDELDARGFDALDTVLEQEKSEFERWNGEAGGALADFTSALDTEGEEAKHDIQAAVAGLDAAKDAATDEHTAASSTLERQLYDFDVEVMREIDTRCGQLSTWLPTWLSGTWAASVTSLATAYRSLSEQLGKDESAAIEQENRYVTSLVEMAETYLAQADTQFEHTASAADEDEREMGEVAALRPQIEHADEEVAEIRALMGALGT